VFQKTKFWVKQASSSKGGDAGEVSPVAGFTKEPLSTYQTWQGHSSDTAAVATQLWGRNVFDIPMPKFMALFKEHATAPFFVFQVGRRSSILSCRACHDERHHHDATMVALPLVLVRCSASCYGCWTRTGCTVCSPSSCSLCLRPCSCKPGSPTSAHCEACAALRSLCLCIVPRCVDIHSTRQMNTCTPTRVQCGPTPTWHSA